MSMNISIVTPWLDHPELIPEYQSAVAGAQVVIVDNGSSKATSKALRHMVESLDNDSVYLRNRENTYFSLANEIGRTEAQRDIILFLNNDIRANPGWLQRVIWDCEASDCLAGPSTGIKAVFGRPYQYIEGWCIAGHRSVWDDLNGWDAEAFRLPYWEDNDLCFRAVAKGFRLLRRNWGIFHLSPGTTSRHIPEAQKAIETNAHIFRKRVMEYYERNNNARQFAVSTSYGPRNSDCAK